MRLPDDELVVFAGSEGRTETALVLDEVLFVELLSGRLLVLLVSVLFSVDLPLDDDDEDEPLLGRVFVPRSPDCAAADDPGRLLPDVLGRLSLGLLPLSGLVDSPLLPGLLGLSLLPGLLPGLSLLPGLPGLPL